MANLLMRMLGKGEPMQNLPVQPATPNISPAMLKSSGLGLGFWVMTPDGVGIVISCLSSGDIVANLCKPDGTNRMKLDPVDKAVVAQYVGALNTIRRAYIDEIPNRHCNSTDTSFHLNDTQFVAYMRNFGYVLSSEAPK